ncbi:putative TIR domain, P-loop containing nucleoside triphosphate hydrolase [Helianthus annuus]|uniref:TIR domain, P-loop containing nucleoside triphosphate hydrolase n=2 Tax=Helianthus annuus TaxID=4232 RepID=A0A9K3DW36_HELAN|nr:disease resistance protein RUN1 [Helianthus annuus]XP_022015525.1 disease resistance protein RUN1 [Helianthus annuus]XP_035840763.1 disease resistance protein RUN1 [Helianthus annuus]XP_035840764.1 disease resistance protein RUN1 [Helianthus annuus]XP_035840765.1 disease resistance protein RUN1 [Helianthus annuus]XP_035840766.1 disease resistance protein RUN1 [Helianthus annuus]XP_035840767.1 disease resistance protein RUN1 [Helianthus annuus]XP_035840768.1 disease resistance protein RUN1
MASSSSSVHNKSYLYDVFLSFSGVDTRKTFVDHLYVALDQYGIRTFKDDERLEKGERISDELLQSIEDSRCYIIIFSKNYASSSWCLNELLKIMECHKTGERTAFPVFYDVEPSEVRKQTGAVGDALAIHRNMNESEVGRWREALKEAANLSGWDVRKTTNGHEAQVIKSIVEKVSLKLWPIDSNVDENLVGMEQRMQALDPYLEIGLNDVRMVGIKGMGGTGKTTLARTIFDKQFVNFEGRSFVENVRETTTRSGLQKLQKQVLRDVLKDKNITVSSVHEGTKLMKTRLRGKKVLLVLDDVDQREQLEALAGNPNWFKLGSRIIITTRDGQVLEAHRVNLIHDVNLLSNEEAICLFSRHAFGKDIPTQEYERRSRKVVSYAVGLPLTIKVLGSDLRGKDDSVWTYTLERLKTIPLKETIQILELSYKNLEDDYKEIFLDVACFLKGWKKEDAIRMLESCGFDAKYGLSVLEQKSLIVTLKGRYDAVIDMHDHLVEMGKNIVRREHPDEPNKHSRLWIEEEIEHAMADNSGSEATKCIDLNITRGIYLKGFGNMKKLRCLIVNHGKHKVSHDLVNHLWYFFGKFWKHDKGRRYFPNSLQYLYWSIYPHWCLPKTFEANNLVALEMSYSKIKQLWEGEKVMEKLKFLNLSYAEELGSLDLGLTPNLERLHLECCYKLVALDVHGGCLKSLVYLNLTECKCLKSISFIEQMESLEVLDLSWLHLREFPDYIIIGHSSSSLLELNLSYNEDIEEVPSSVGNLYKLVSLNLTRCSNLKSLPGSICSLQHLTTLKLGYTRIEELPEDLGQLECLEYLYLSRTKVKHLPGSICMLRHLETLDLSGCLRLEKLPEDVGQLESLEKLDLQHCRNLREIPNSICKLKCLKQLRLGGCKRVEKLPDELGNLKCLQYLEVWGTGITQLPQSIYSVKGLKINKPHDELL